MDSTLVSINKHIAYINENSNLAEIKERCREIQALTSQLKGYKSYYLIYLVEVYAIKLHDLKTAEEIC